MRDSKSSRALAFFLENADANGWSSLSDAYEVLRGKFPDTTVQTLYALKGRADKALKAQRRGPQPESFDQSPVTATIENGEVLTPKELKTVHPKIRKKVVLLITRLADVEKDNATLRSVTNGKKRKLSELRQERAIAENSRKAVDVLVHGLVAGRPARETAKEAVLTALGIKE